MRTAVHRLMMGILFLKITLSCAGASAATVYGSVHHLGHGIPNASALLFSTSGAYLVQARTDGAGLFAITGVEAGVYQIKVEAQNYASEWHPGVMDPAEAAPFVVVDGVSTTLPVFNLVEGEAPAWAWVNSDPPGAQIYLDYRATPYLTPARIAIGEPASRTHQHPSDPIWQTRASHVISVRKEGYPWPPPQFVPGLSAETCRDYFSTDRYDTFYTASLCDDFFVSGLCDDYFVAGIDPCGDFFDLNSHHAATLSVATDPVGAEVFVDSTDEPAGLSPLTVSNLLQGGHTVFIRKEGYLQPKPIRVFTSIHENTPVSVTLTPIGGPSNLLATVHSSPTGAFVVLDAHVLTNRTSASLPWLDARPITGVRQYSVSHPVTVETNGYLTPLAVHLLDTEQTNTLNVSFPLKLDALQNPDFVVSALACTSVLKWLSIEVTVSNRSPVSADAGTFGLWLNRTGGIPCGATADMATALGVLQAHSITTLVYIGLDPGIIPKTNCLSVFVNSSCAVREFSTQNNQKALAYRVVGPSGTFSFRATALTNNVLLRWTSPRALGMNSDTVHIRVQTNQYPEALTEGGAVYTGAAPMYNHGGLTPLQPYYYTLWLTHDDLHFIEPPP